MRSYILVTAAWIMIFICGCVVGVMLPYDPFPVGNERVVSEPVPMKKGVDGLVPTISVTEYPLTR